MLVKLTLHFIHPHGKALEGDSFCVQKQLKFVKKGGLQHCSSDRLLLLELIVPP